MSDTWNFAADLTGSFAEDRAKLAELLAGGESPDDDADDADAGTADGGTG